MKRCPKCDTVKPLTSFHVQKEKKDGLRATCKSCCSEYRKAYRIKNKEIIKEKDRLYRLENKERRYEYDKRHRAENREHYLKTKRLYKEENKEKLFVQNQEWKRNNKDKVNATNALRRAQKLQATPSWYNKEEVQYIYQLAQEKELVVDHIVPLNSDKVCGLNVQDNLRCIPAKLNAYKSNRYWSDM